MECVCHGSPITGWQIACSMDLLVQGYRLDRERSISLNWLACRMFALSYRPGVGGMLLKSRSFRSAIASNRVDRLL